MLLAANAAGALTGGVILEMRGVLQANPKLAFVLVIVWCLCMGGFALSTVYILSLVLLFAAGFLNLAFGAMAQTLVQLHAPGAIRGRVIGLFGTSFNGMRAFSGITVGMAGSLIGVHASLAVSAAGLMAIPAVRFARGFTGQRAPPAARAGFSGTGDHASSSLYQHTPRS